MKSLTLLDRKDYDLSLPRLIRESVRAIIIRNNKIAMIYSEKYGIYVFPGGEIEEGETKIEALIRETREETGLIVKPQSAKEFGMATEIRKDMKAERIFEQRNFFYTCDVEDVVLEQALSQEENDEGYQLVFVSFDEAIAANELEPQPGRMRSERETYVLKLLHRTMF